LALLAPEIAMTPKDSQFDPRVVDKLETLDDVMFTAIEGDLHALGQAEPTWHEALSALGPAVVEESRREYLRYARATWRRLASQTVQNPLGMLAVMRIIGLLMGDDV
jgi:hypothetical protein